MKALVVANWKMNPSSHAQAKRLLDASKKALEKTTGVSLIVAPPALYLREFAGSSKGKRIAFAAQNAHAALGGAHTGEISMKQVKDAKASYVIIGHAERRAAGESDDDVKAKVAAALALNLTPILCVGEASRGAQGEYFEFIGTQLRAGLKDVAQNKVAKAIIAYEPIWAIGATAAMRPRDMREMAIFIRKTIVDQHGAGAMSIRVLYGGSIEAANAAEMLAEGDVAGLLVGRASADVQQVSQLMEAIGG